MEKTRSNFWLAWAAGTYGIMFISIALGTEMLWFFIKWAIWNIFCMWSQKND